MMPWMLRAASGQRASQMSFHTPVFARTPAVQVTADDHCSLDGSLASVISVGAPPLVRTNWLTAFHTVTVFR